MKKTPAVLLVLCFFLTQGLSAQNDNRTAFRFITSSATGAEQEEINSGPKFEKAFAIYSDLVEARGDNRYPVPAFRMAKSAKYVAFLEADGLSIGIEEKAFDLCLSLGEREGENALATLIGHELIHFYEKHQWRTNFAEAFSELEIGRTLGSTDLLAKVNNETQSDYLGGFLAYSAGYDVFDNMPAFFDQVYDAYNMEDEIPGYPSRSDRKALAERSVERLQELVQIFDLANVMTAIGRYGDARALYKYILIDYQGRELYNNLGVVTLLEAYSYEADKQVSAYRLPVVLDLGLGAGSKDGFATADSLKRALAREAIGYFNSALSLDSDYAPAMLNKACAFYVLNDLNRARFYAETEALSLGQLDTAKFGKTIQDAKILSALIQIREGNDQRGREILEDLATDREIARYNLRILNDQPPPSGPAPGGPEFEEIEDIAIGQLFMKTRTNMAVAPPKSLFGGTEEVRIWRESIGLEQSTIFRYRPPIGSEGALLLVHLTDSDYTGETFDGYKVGTPFSDIKHGDMQYGEPKTTIETPAGAIAVYREVIFFLDQDEKVRRWANYFQR